MWTKPVVMNAVLKLEYTCLFTDLDTVWFKPAVRAMSLVLDQHDADMVGMNDGNGGESGDRINYVLAIILGESS